MSQPVNQHWVPQFYLKYFATPETQRTKNPKTWIFSKNDEDGDPRLTNIRNICAKRFLYSPPNKEGQREWGLEAKLSGIEQLLSVIWPTLAEGYADLLWEPLRKAVSLFVSILYLRHPNGLKQCVEAHKHLVTLYDQVSKKPDGTPDIAYVETNGKLQKFDASDWHEYKKWNQDDHHRFFCDSVQAHAGHMAKLLLKKRWSIIFADTPAFITSDNPVCKDHLEKEKFGFGTEGTIVTFPISPTRLLIMDDNHNEPAGQHYPLCADGPGPFNLGIWKNGSRFMISQRDVDEVLAEMLEWAEYQTSESA
ncbi:MAG: DUF4238 domain-containing protein [Trichlorobacter sp.]|uniref:DUF4238 domain-containing protein n=1 Tax=Trichlorobacter sp. TaxID=2911007 RepID=UPI00256CB37D|nr:DUF4238 domain-containing protein [Trichlorobacter sp.]MDK9716892.1 DUF4238 domain-containing protein [Trichlorobacter sp.]